MLVEQLRFSNFVTSSILFEEGSPRTIHYVAWSSNGMSEYSGVKTDHPWMDLRGEQDGGKLQVLLSSAGMGYQLEFLMGVHLMETRTYERRK